MTPRPSEGSLPDGIWRDGNVLVIRRGVQLPRWCAVCGETVEGKMNRIRLREGSGIYFDAAGLGAELAKDSTFIRYGHCRVHAPWMRPGVAKALGFAGCCGAGIFSVGATLAYRERMLMAWPLGALAVASVVAMFGTIGWEPPINLESLDERYARLSGFGGGYLNRIPDFDAARDRANAEVAANLERLAEFEE